VRNTGLVLALSFLLCWPDKANSTHAASDKVVEVELVPLPGEGMDRWLIRSQDIIYDPYSPLSVVGNLELFGDHVESDVLLRFDLSGMPQKAEKVLVWIYAIVNYPYEYPGMELGIVTEQWQTGSLAWDNVPNSVNWLTLPTPANFGWSSIDITEIYNGWRMAGKQFPSNFGLILTPQPNLSASHTVIIYSSNNPLPTSKNYTGGPFLQVRYRPKPAQDNELHLKWPLETPYLERFVTARWGKASALTCPDGTNKQHNGVDYRATPGLAVYATEDGVVKSVYDSGSAGWASRVVIEHKGPQAISLKYTTVYWHIDPEVKEGDFVPKGYRIATVADLVPFGHDTHLHFGIRRGAYNAKVSGLGALPFASHPCGPYPVFPANFLNPENAKLVIFE